MKGYRVQVFIGHTDGKPSWGTFDRTMHYTKAAAAEAIERAKVIWGDKRQFRIRKIKRR